MASRRLSRSPLEILSSSFSSLQTAHPDPKRALADLDQPISDPLPTVSLAPPAPPSLLARFLRSHLPSPFKVSDLLHFFRRRLRHHPFFAPYDLHVFLWAASSSDTFRHDHSTYEYIARSLASSFRLDSLCIFLRYLLAHPCPCSDSSSPGGSIFSCPRLPHIYRAAISAFTSAGRLDDAFQSLSDARRSIDGRPDPSLYNILIHAFGRHGDHSRAVECYESMLKDRVKPDARTFNILINSSRKNCDLHSALAWFREMKAKNVEPNVVSFNTLITGFLKEKRFREGISAAHEMLDVGFKPSAPTCEILIHGLCRDGRSQEACELLMDFLAKRVVPDEFDCLTLIQTLCREGKAEEGLQILRSFWGKGKNPVGVVTCTTLIEGLKKSGKVDEAYGVMKTMMEEKSLLPDRITFNSLMDELCSVGRAMEADKLRILAAGKGFYPDAATFGILVRGFAREGRKEERKRVVDEMLDAGFIPNIAAYNRLMKNFHSFK